MSDLKISVTGAAGRMGRAVIRSVSQAEGAGLVAAVEHPGASVIGADSGHLTGIGGNGINVCDDLDAALEKSDVVIDFTVPAATVDIAFKAGTYNCIHITGTTGFTVEQETEITKASANATIVKSGNMSLGINLLAALIEQASKALPASEFDIEILEMHHKRKVDAPSGTALLLGEAAARGRNIELTENSIRNRDGITGARKEGKIGFATLRGGAVIGDHSVILAGNGERIELSHKAEDRSLFAEGAVHAARWAMGKPSGLYSMKDVLGL